MTRHKAPILALAGLLAVLVAPAGLLGAASPALQKAKQESESKGFLFETSADEIVAKAKKEGRLRVLTSLDIDALKLVADAFKKKYPFIDLRAEEIAGTDSHQRLILEMKAGTTSGWDVIHLTTDSYDDYFPYVKKFDILGMSQHGVLRIPRGMIDPVNRNIVSYTTNTQVVAYNKQLLPEANLLNTWEDFLRPEFKGKKFLVDIRPQEVANLVPAWGLEKTLQFAKAIAAQNPIWIRGHARSLASMSVGEYPMLLGANLNSTKRAMDKDRLGVLNYKAVEPVPIRIANHEGVYMKSSSPHAGLLWLEFVGSPEAQKIIDHDLKGSVFFPGTTPYQLTQGRKVSLVAWEHASQLEELQKKVFEAYGFPKAQSTGK